MPAQLAISILASEAPDDGAVVVVAAALPGRHYGRDRVPVLEMPAKTLALQDAPLCQTFGPIECTLCACIKPNSDVSVLYVQSASCAFTSIPPRMTATSAIAGCRSSQPRTSILKVRWSMLTNGETRAKRAMWRSGCSTNVCMFCASRKRVMESG